MILQECEVWPRILHRLELAVSQQAFDTWIKQIRPAPTEPSDDDGVLRLCVSSRFVLDWVRSHYLDVIGDCAKREMGDVQIEFDVAPGPEPDAPPAPEEPPSPDLFAYAKRSAGSRYLCQLNPRYIFDTFVIGPSNQFAHAASLAVAESPAKAYNPLFIHGPVGLGKTHLMQAIGHFLLAKRPDARVVYVSCERFTNDLIDAIHKRKLVQFRERYRTVDVLLIDDIHFLAGKESTQEEFFHTFNTLHDAHHQIVISSDRSPKEIATLQERLVSRFEWGLVADIQAPDVETRRAILRKKQEQEGVDLPEPVADYIVQNIRYNIRELEGALIRLMAYSSLVKKAIDLDLAKEVLCDLLPARGRADITAEQIIDHVASHFHISRKEMTGSRRTRSIVFPRQIAMYLTRELTSRSLPEIGRCFGNRDHTTVLHACNRIRQALVTDPGLPSTIERIRASL